MKDCDDAKSEHVATMCGNRGYFFSVDLVKSYGKYCEADGHRFSPQNLKLELEIGG